MKALSIVEFEEYIKGLGASIGDIIYFDGTGLAALPAGQAGYALVSGGPGSPPSFSSSVSGSGGALSKTITDHFGGSANDLDSLNSASYTTGDSIMFKDASDYLWAYVLKAGTLEGGTISTVTPGTDVIEDSSANFQNLAVNDRIQFTTTGALPGGLSRFTSYYIKTKPSATSATLSTSLGGATLDISSLGSGTHFWTRFEVPYRVMPADYNPSSRAFYWEMVRAKWNYFPLSFVAFSGSASLVNVYLARHTFDFEICGWGLSCEVPVATPGSGGAASFLANLKKTASNNNTVGSALAPADLSLGVGIYYVHSDFTRPDHIISVAAGEALYLGTITAGNVAPQGVEVHLYCRRPVVMI
jgi:hypothetical protein